MDAPPAAPTPDLMAVSFWARLELWLGSKAGRSEVIEQIHRYRQATLHGPVIIDSPMDRAIWRKLSDHLHLIAR